MKRELKFLALLLCGCFSGSSFALDTSTAIIKATDAAGSAAQQVVKTGRNVVSKAGDVATGALSDPPIPMSSADRANSVSPIVQEVKDSEPTKEEILQVKKVWAEVNDAKGRPVGDQAKPTISLVNVDLSPGSTPPIVRTAMGSGSIISFIDATGRDWPIVSITNMSESTVEVPSKPIEGAPNSMSVKIKIEGASGNFAVFLEGSTTPVVVTALSSQKNIDYRVDMRIPAIRKVGKSGGAGQVGTISDSGAQSLENGVSRTAWDDKLSDALMNLTPSGCKAKSTSNVDVSVWECDGKQSIVRSKGVMLSPATLNNRKLIASDSTKAYLIPSTPILSMLINGSSTSVKVTDKE